MPQPEPWLRPILLDIHPIPRHLLHALQLAHEDALLHCAPLTDPQLNARPHSLAPVAFHLRHIARSLDRLLTYAESLPLCQLQLEALATELAPEATTHHVLTELESALTLSATRIQTFPLKAYPEPRTVGRAALPTTLAALLIHCAEHTQRHIGQAITTAQLVQRMADNSISAGRLTKSTPLL